MHLGGYVQSNLDEKKTVLSLMRWTIYFCILMLCVFSMWHFASIFKEATFEEYGIVEDVQLILLACSAFSFLGQAFFKTPYRSLSLFFSSLCLTAFCRELDAWFDEFWILGWKFSLIFPVIAFIYVCYHFNEFRKSVVTFCSSPAFFMMYTTAIIILPVAQCVGHKNFFADSLGFVADPRLVRRLFEESVEFIGYVLLFLASIEYYITLIKSTSKRFSKKIK